MSNCTLDVVVPRNSLAQLSSKLMSAPSSDKSAKQEGWSLTLITILFWYWFFGVLYFGDFKDGSANPLTWFLSLGSGGDGFPSVWEWAKFLLIPPLVLLVLLVGWYFVSVMLADRALPLAGYGLSSIRAKSRLAKRRVARIAWGLLYVLLCLSPIVVFVGVAWLVSWLK